MSKASSRNRIWLVIPAKAGIQYGNVFIGFPRRKASRGDLRWNDMTWYEIATPAILRPCSGQEKRRARNDLKTVLVTNFIGVLNSRVYAACC
jgi:hypothetical protein